MKTAKVEILEFLPDEGVAGTLYLYLSPQAPPIEHDEWSVLNWDGKQYHSHGSAPSLENIRVVAVNLPWAKGWPRYLCCAREQEINPCVKVEFEYQDGRSQQLTGDAAEKWLKDVNAILAAHGLRYGQDQPNKHPWTFSKRDIDV